LTVRAPAQTPGLRERSRWSSSPNAFGGRIETKAKSKRDVIS
jgi:hypothetical protein